MSEDLVAVSRLSPAPTASDYDAICAALMQTERGRWFLQEYALRNRSADTQLLLSAIERIEAAVCAERSRQAQQSFRTDLMEMASAITRTRAEVAEIKPGAPGLTEEETPGRQQPPGDVFAAAERIRDVTWAMRGHGFDPSTCQQLEELAGTILSATALRDPTDHRAGKLSEVLQYLERRIATLLDSCVETEAPPERVGKPEREALALLPTAAEGRDGRGSILAMPTGDDGDETAESRQIRAFLAALHDDLEDLPAPPPPSVAIQAPEAALALAADAASLQATPPRLRDQEAAQTPPEAVVKPPAVDAETAPIGAETIAVSGDRLLKALPGLAAPGDPPNGLPVRLMAIVSSPRAEAASARPAPSNPDLPDREEAGLPFQLVGNDPLAALRAMSEDELIALFS